jgi:hypothetical protein
MLTRGSTFDNSAKELPCSAKISLLAYMGFYFCEPILKSTKPRLQKHVELFSIHLSSILYPMKSTTMSRTGIARIFAGNRFYLLAIFVLLIELIALAILL